MITSDTIFWVVVVVVLGYFGWMWVDMRRLIRYPGCRGGVRIWQEPLAPDIAHVVRSLARDVVEPNRWLHVKDGVIRVQSRRAGWSTAWPYVAIIDARIHPPVIQYHMSLPALLGVLPFVATIIAAPLVVALLLMNHWMERRAIYEFLRRLPPNHVAVGNDPVSQD